MVSCRKVRMRSKKEERCREPDCSLAVRGLGGPSAIAFARISHGNGKGAQREAPIRPLSGPSGRRDGAPRFAEALLLLLLELLLPPRKS